MVWEALVKAVLLGTQRLGQRPLAEMVPLSEEMEPLIDGDSLEVEILQVLAIASVQRRAGRVLPRGVAEGRVEVAPEERLPRCSLAASRLLHESLQGEEVEERLGLWLGWAREAGVRVPAECLPQVLEVGRQGRNLRSLMLPVLGYRGYWLAAQNSDWQFAALAVVGVTPEEGWGEGNLPTRLFWLRQMRLADPDQAREWVSGVWEAHKAGDRTEYLKCFHLGLTAADEPFLEGALGDKSQQVREMAARLLTRLPESGFVQRVRQWLAGRLERSPQGLKVTLPEMMTPEMRRDGVREKPPAKVPRQPWWFLQQLARVPPRVWAQGEEIEVWLGLAREHPLWEYLWEGWAIAAMIHQDRDWARCLLGLEIPGRLEGDLERDRTLLHSLPLEEREAWILGHLQAHPQRMSKRHPSLRQLQLCDWPWRDEFSRGIFQRFRGDILASQDHYDWAVRSTFRRFSHWMNPRLQGEFRESLLPEMKPQSYWRQTVEQFLDLLVFREGLDEANRE
ncbi:DUF5691 domain-containing protein [Phormidium yuhuli AB48]|uniref:DUF5691 domain-containing protein n=1 Tax=Phormidium yuhuli AB48 TaxID=2940671 RepID=A0ABY5ALX1_9CYAN|nr:DUF5691 domain-containing protein [Phormidium yuhuli]USR89815.1 DUF5691 domain-containing protein [Phormidium yuhuli AB48]